MQRPAMVGNGVDRRAKVGTGLVGTGRDRLAVEGYDMVMDGIGSECNGLVWTGVVRQVRANPIGG